MCINSIKKRKIFPVPFFEDEDKKPKVYTHTEIHFNLISLQDCDMVDCLKQIIDVNKSLSVFELCV